MASISRRNGAWQYRVSYKDGTTYRNKTRGGFNTKRAAQLAAADIETKLGRGANLMASERLFCELFREWYETFIEGKYSPDNQRLVERIVRFSERVFPGMRIREVDRTIYQQALNKFGETHATETVRKYNIYMRAFIRYEIEEGAIFRDPTYKAKAIGNVPEKKESLKYINFSDTQKLITEVRKDMRPKYVSRYMILFQLATGCRLEEVLGMTWDCINFKKRTIKINKSWDYKDTLDFGGLKNKASYRTITIDKKTLQIIKKLKAHQSEVHLATGLENAKNLVFANDQMQLISPEALNKVLKKLCKRLELIELTSHGLRHTHASILLLHKRVTLKYLSRRLGHENIITTLQTYAHVLDELEQLEDRSVDDTMEDLYQESPNS
ncbi:tyrosine-type recombinase/integrase [Sporolactobacillus nakayamae]|uniref:Site-specific recombinase XerD n=1 Tax=Sporolactobacillus nakayamae TaxID=269670 RepID=A0A1I2P078_9BACL|nr:tyrosine-type recombinase/integrase [Sporolactobacillus nakayamae]SFG09398.1 Site-specific recombinase XerD [Sporolactobacillus nakayamae]